MSEDLLNMTEEEMCEHFKEWFNLKEKQIPECLPWSEEDCIFCPQDGIATLGDDLDAI